jgi:type III pantothenate kinase
MSQWLFDLGNTRLKYAPSLGGVAGEVAVWAHQDQQRPLPEPAQLPGGDVAWLASVADPVLRDQLRARLGERFARVELATSIAQCGRLRNGYAEPEKLGVDRFLALLACSQWQADCLLVGVGTALTVDLLAADGQHHGGLIAPSPTSMRQAIHAKARHLPVDGGQINDFANNTLDALAGGSLGAALGLIQRSLGQATARLGRVPQLVVHGGGAEQLLPYLFDVRHVPTLVLDGLAAWALHQNPASR